jgi:hypothetical protein
VSKPIVQNYKFDFPLASISAGPLLVDRRLAFDEGVHDLGI